MMRLINPTQIFCSAVAYENPLELYPDMIGSIPFDISQQEVNLGFIFSSNVQDSLLAIFSRSLYDKLVNTRRNGAKKCMSITSELIPDITSAVYITSFTAEELSKASTLVSVKESLV